MRVVVYVLAGWCAASLLTAALYVGLSELYLATIRRTSRKRGTRPDGGSPLRSASTTERERGTRTPGMATTEECSFSTAPGVLSAVSLDPTLPLRVNSYIALGSSIYVTGILGVNGEPRTLAD